MAHLGAPYGALTLAYARTRGLPTLAIGPGGDLDIAAITPQGAGQAVRFADGHEVALPLLGAFQAENALLAAGLAMATGAEHDAVLAALPDLPGVPDGWSASGRTRTALSSWTMPTSRRRWPPCWTRCAPPYRAGSWSCLAAAATATGESARSWAGLPARGRMW